MTNTLSASLRRYYPVQVMRVRAVGSMDTSFRAISAKAPLALLSTIEVVSGNVNSFYPLWVMRLYADGKMPVLFLNKAAKRLGLL